jgi:hypothetical protein
MECDLLLPLSSCSTVSFPYGHSVVAYIYFLVFSLLLHKMATVFIPKASNLNFRASECFLTVIISSTCQVSHVSACNNVRVFIRLLWTSKSKWTLQAKYWSNRVIIYCEDSTLPWCDAVLVVEMPQTFRRQLSSLFSRVGTRGKGWRVLTALSDYSASHPEVMNPQQNSSENIKFRKSMPLTKRTTACNVTINTTL